MKKKRSFKYILTFQPIIESSSLPCNFPQSPLSPFLRTSATTYSLFITQLISLQSSQDNEIFKTKKRKTTFSCLSNQFYKKNYLSPVVLPQSPIIADLCNHILSPYHTRSMQSLLLIVLRRWVQIFIESLSNINIKDWYDPVFHPPSSMPIIFCK